MIYDEGLVSSVATALSDIELTGGTYVAFTPDDAKQLARAAIAAVLEWQGKSGYVLAPAEPTPEMIVAGIAERHDSGVPEAWSKATANIYRAMLAAL